jgi:hypothetical protein
MQSLNPGMAVEKTLWHGTAPDSLDNINRWGFNRSYCGKNGKSFALYFVSIKIPELRSLWESNFHNFTSHRLSVKLKEYSNVSTDNNIIRGKMPL